MTQPEETEDISSQKAKKQSQASTIARNTSSVLAGQLVVRILAFIFNVWVVRQLGEIGMGRYAAALAYVAIFAILTDWGSTSYSVREMSRRPEITPEMTADIIVLRLGLSFIVLVGLTISAELVSDTAFETIGVFVASVSLLAYAYQGPLQALLISQERLDIMSLLLLLKQIIFMLTGFAFVLFDWGYLGLLVGTVISILAMAIGSNIWVYRVLGMRLSRPNLKRFPDLVRGAMPFGFNGGATVLSRRFAIVFMAFVLTDAEVGWYSVPFNLMFMSIIVAQSLGQSMYPTMVKAYNNGTGSIDSTVQRAVRYLLLIALPISIGGILLADRIIIVLYEARFEPSIITFQIMLLSLPFMYLAEILARTAATIHREKNVATLSIGVMVFNIVLLVILVPNFGIEGAAVAFLLTRVARVTGLIYIVGWRTVIGRESALANTALAATSMALVVWLVAARQTAIPENRIVLVGLVLLGGVVYTVAVPLLRAVTKQEQQYIRRAVQQRIRRLAGAPAA